MSEQTQVVRERRQHEMDQLAAEAVGEQAAKARAAAEEKLAEADELLDEIEELLAEQGIGNRTEAEAFVAGYIQKGGE